MSVPAVSKNFWCLTCKVPDIFNILLRSHISVAYWDWPDVAVHYAISKCYVDSTENRAGAWWAVRRYELSYWTASAKKMKKMIWKIRSKTKKNYKRGRRSADICSRAAFAQPGPVSSISLGRFFSVRVSETGTWLRSGRLICSARYHAPEVRICSWSETSFSSANLI